MSVTIRIVDSSEVGRAHAWHSGFAAANDALFPRKPEDFERLAFSRSLWCAITSEDEIMAMSYVDSEDDRIIEAGGLMVAAQARGTGLGTAIFRAPLAHFVMTERPQCWRNPPTIIAHILQGNDMPRRIIEETGFVFAHPVERSGDELPGLRQCEDGMVRGDELHLDWSLALPALAGWAGTWTGALRDGRAIDVLMLDGETMADLAIGLAEMATPSRQARAASG